MSYNNYLDADAAYQCVCDFPPVSEPTCVIVKHTNPCGVATRGDLKEAYQLAVKADPISAFGGIVAFNQVRTIMDMDMDMDIDRDRDRDMEMDMIWIWIWIYMDEYGNGNGWIWIWI